MRWTDIDLDKAIVAIQRTLQWHTTGGFYFAETKTKGSRRTVPLPTSLIEHLKALVRVRRKDS